jgi:PAS domain S-box-containing protein
VRLGRKDAGRGTCRQDAGLTSGEVVPKGDVMTELIDACERTALRRFIPGDAFRAMAECVDRCLFCTDMRGRFVLVNRPFCCWLGKCESEILGRTVYDFWPHGVAADLDADDRRALLGERIERETSFSSPSEVRTVRLVKKRLCDEHGLITGVLTVFADITHQRQADAELHYAQRFAAVGRLAGGLTHDLNHLLTLIGGNAALLATAAVGNGAVSEIAARLETAADRAVDLTRRLVALARTERTNGEAPRASATDINFVAGEVTGLICPLLPKNIVLDLRTTPELPSVPPPPEQLTQIVLNLCLNARDAMPGGGRLTVETDLVRLTTDEARVGTDRRPGKFVCLQVRDTGHGIAPQRRLRIFDAAYTTKPEGKGTGLGLSVVRDIVHQHGGWIECSEAHGGGTSFAVYLPPATPELQPAPIAANLTESMNTVLLVDNDRCILTLCRAILESGGYRVLTAEDGRAALDLFRNGSQGISVVLLDQFMPALSGIATARELRALDSTVRLVLVSGAPPEGSEAGTLFHAFLNKPFRADQLLQTIQNVLAKS